MRLCFLCCFLRFSSLAFPGAFLSDCFPREEKILGVFLAMEDLERTVNGVSVGEAFVRIYIFILLVWFLFG
ncbi:uncharacterized protein BO96DRAFT_84646 [Aspergillus niger CBS 101883]|uniref:uncharacterized protein n=1 Tax=Aspergillus lacticoffeatus (strain CBS 101883) TaxID=1450533 RepID=UPI000D7FB0F0|nr:uncharacterized protein BO96DRAFT_84646 [Aspergillus niger CBS 101883]PYH54975.1 hypothetical protein BO96DRAFT_84646 [Aspergillus niger CBS 101883]